MAVEFDLAGLAEAGQSRKSILQLPPPLVEFSIHELLHQILDQLDLAYEVKDGSLMITSQRALDRLHQSIRVQLDHPVILTWSEDDSLETVIDRFRVETRTASFPDGLPVFVQLEGPSSPENLLILPPPAPKELPIREQLSRLLEPLGLRYELKDGAIMIVTVKERDD